MNSGKLTKLESEWRAMVVDFAESSTWLNDMYGNDCITPQAFEIDHILGAKAKRKINGETVKVGELAIMPLSFELHNIRSNHELNRTLRPAAYRKMYGHEKQVWRDMLDAMVDAGYELPFNNDLIEGVMR